MKERLGASLGYDSTDLPIIPEWPIEEGRSTGKKTQQSTFFLMFLMFKL
jgi:hypothetical protein